MQRPLSEVRLHHVKPMVAPGLQPWKPAPRPHPRWGVDDLRLHLTSRGYAPPPGKRTTGPKGAQECRVPSHTSQGLPPSPSAPLLGVPHPQFWTADAQSSQRPGPQGAHTRPRVTKSFVNCLQLLRGRVLSNALVRSQEKSLPTGHVCSPCGPRDSHAPAL